jgi:hypothetical protein
MLTPEDTALAQRGYTVTNPVLHISFEVRAQSISHALHVAEYTWKSDPRSAEYPDAMRDGLRGVWLEVV